MLLRYEVIQVSSSNSLWHTTPGGEIKFGYKKTRETHGSDLVAKYGTMIGLALFEHYRKYCHTHTHTLHCTNSRVLNTLSVKVILLSVDKGIVEEWSLFDQPYLYG